MIYRQIETLVEKYGHKISEPIRDLPDELINTILYGSDDILNVKTEFAGDHIHHIRLFIRELLVLSSRKIWRPLRQLSEMGK